MTIHTDISEVLGKALRRWWPSAEERKRLEEEIRNRTESEIVALLEEQGWPASPNPQKWYDLAAKNSRHGNGGVAAHAKEAFDVRGIAAP